MLDGVDEGFFECELDAEDFFFRELAGLQLTFDVFLNLACLGGVAGDLDSDGLLGGLLAHKVHLTASG